MFHNLCRNSEIRWVQEAKWYSSKKCPQFQDLSCTAGFCWSHVSFRAHLFIPQGSTRPHEHNVLCVGYFTPQNSAAARVRKSLLLKFVSLGSLSRVFSIWLSFRCLSLLTYRCLLAPKLLSLFSGTDVSSLGRNRPKFYWKVQILATVRHLTWENIKKILATGSWMETSLLPGK